MGVFQNQALNASLMHNKPIEYIFAGMRRSDLTFEDYEAERYPVKFEVEEELEIAGS
jgi:hypothetical protein